MVPLSRTDKAIECNSKTNVHPSESGYSKIDTPSGDDISGYTESAGSSTESGYHGGINNWPVTLCGDFNGNVTYFPEYSEALAYLLVESNFTTAAKRIRGKVV